MWTIRSGWLVGSLLAQMPAWQLMDPLLILDTYDDEETGDVDYHGDDQTIEDMFEEQERAKQELT